ncbi:hypothetical protein [Stackebrandtia soli]|uniref:hypothetical protein n=1 Tax=Stackebrandtia soli TaxID=1892856 RepID=UPI0039EA4E40
MNDRMVKLGTFQADGRSVSVNMRDDVATTAWLVVQMSNVDNSDLGTIKRLDLDEPELVIFQRHQDWCKDPWTRWHITRQARDLYRRAGGTGD